MESHNPDVESPMPFSPAAGCLVSFILAAIPICLMLGIAALAIRGEIIVERGPVRQQRLWLVREGAEQGLGYSRMLRVSGSEESGEVCYKTQVSFLLWKSLQVKRQAAFCDCYQLNPSGWLPAGGCQ